MKWNRLSLAWIFGLLMWTHGVAAKQVTIFFVIDDSNSMNTHQIKLGQTADAFVENLKRKGCLNFRVAFHYTSTASLKTKRLIGNPTYITEQTPDALDLIRRRMSGGRSMDDAERILEGLLTVVDEERELLAEQDLVVAIIMSDVGPSYDKVTSEDALKKIWSIIPKSKFVAYGFGVDFERPPQCGVDYNRCDNLSGPELLGCAQKNKLSSPFLMRDFTRASGGAHLNLCQNDYDMDMQIIADSIFEKAQCTDPVLF